MKKATPRFKVISLVVITGLISTFLGFGIPVETSAASTIKLTKMVGFNGRAWTLTEPDVNGTRFIGGDFSSYNPWITGRGAWVDSTSGSVDATFGSVSGGDVFASVPDGAGGVFIAGAFSSVDGIGRNRVAHINSNGEVDSVFAPGAINNEVWGLDVDSNAVYIGGKFTTVDGVTRNNVAALDRTTGALLSWNPSASSWVHTVAVSGTSVFLGGRFTTVGGLSRIEVAKVRTDARSNSTGTCLTNYDSTDCLESFTAPITGGYGVFDLVVDSGNLYAGGSYSATQSGVTVSSLAKFDATTGSMDTSWNPAITGNTTTGISTGSNPGGPLVYTMEISGSSIYFGGKFTSVGGQSRSRLAAVSLTNASPTSWAPIAASGGVYNSNNNLELQDSVSSLDISGGTVYLSGGFFSINGIARNRVGAVDATTGALTAWDPHACDGSNGVATHVRTVTSLGSKVFVGGNFDCMGGLKRYHAAAVGANGILTDWNPEVNAPVQEMSSDGTNIYMVGRFTKVNDNVRQYAAAVRTDETVTAWDPQLSVGLCGGGEKQSVLQTSNYVYVGGCFTTVGGVARTGLAATDRTTGALVTGFNANVGQADVRSLGVDSDRLYVGGAFSTVGGQSRTWIAAVNKETGALDTGWDAGAITASYDAGVRKAIHSIKVKDSKVYVGGWFGSIGGVTQRYLAALDRTTGALDTTWRPNLGTSGSGGLFTIAIVGDRIYFGGANGSPISGTAFGYASLTDASVATWMNSSGTTEIRGITASDGAAFIAGEFGSVSGSSRSKTAAIGLDGTVLAPWPMDSAVTVPVAVSISTAGVAPGIVVSSPGGINCGGACAYGFASSETVTLTAVPQSGTDFGGWSGACSTLSTTCTISVSSAASATANFVAVGAAPTASPTPSSSATPTASATPTVSATPTASSSPTASGTATASAAPSSTSTPVVTVKTNSDSDDSETDSPLTLEPETEATPTSTPDTQPTEPDLNANDAKSNADKESNRFTGPQLAAVLAIAGFVGFLLLVFRRRKQGN